MNTITAGTSVKFLSPEDGREYVGVVEKISQTSIATIKYNHVSFGDSYESREYLKVMKLAMV